MIQSGKKYLVTTDSWFVGPDGLMYTSAWGKAEILKAEDCFGFIPQKPSTNWFLKIGTDDKYIIVAGCQIHFAVRCKDKPVLRDQKYYTAEGEERLSNRIYFAE